MLLVTPIRVRWSTSYSVGGVSFCFKKAVTTTWAYRDDANGRDNVLDSINTSHPGGAGQVVGTYSYTWDNNRNKTAESISGVMSGYGFSSSTFDNDDRLTAWSRTDGNQDQSWNLSATGNWPGSAR